MSVSANKDIVRKYFAVANASDRQAILDMITEDFTLQSMPREPEWLIVKMDREQFANAPAFMSQFMTSPIQMQIVSMTAEDDRVAVEATSYGPMKSGKVYENKYHFLFTLRDGKISGIREYSCSYHAAQVLGDMFAGL